MFALYDKSTGLIRQYQSCPDCPDAETGSLDIGDEYRGLFDMYYIVENAIMQRPVRPTVVTSGVVPMVIDLTLFPSGTQIEFKNADGDTATVTPTDELQLSDPGLYFAKVMAPFPHQSFSYKIEVKR